MPYLLHVTAIPLLYNTCISFWYFWKKLVIHVEQWIYALPGYLIFLDCSREAEISKNTLQLCSEEKSLDAIKGLYRTLSTIYRGS